MNVNGKNIPKFDEKLKILINCIFFKADVKYIKRLHNFHNNLPFLSERININRCHKLICNLHDKNNYVAGIITLKPALNHGLILKKVHRAIQFNKQVWLKSYIDMNTKWGTETKSDFEKGFF